MALTRKEKRSSLAIRTCDEPEVKPTKVTAILRRTAADVRATEPPVSKNAVAKLKLAMDQLQHDVEAKRAKMTVEQRVEEEARIAALIAKNKAATEAWIRNPPWFAFYDPFLSVLSAKTPQFVNRDGKKIKFRRPGGARHLLYIAVQAADLFLCGNKISRSVWTQTLESMKGNLAELRSLMAEKNFVFQDPLGKRVEIDVGGLEPFDVLSIQQQVFDRDGSAKEAGDFALLQQVWCVVCMAEIDHALLSAMYDDAGDGVESALRAREALQKARDSSRILVKALGAETNEAGDRGAVVVAVRSDFARLGALAKLEKDPKQKAKQEVRAAWNEWQRRPHMYASKSAFANELLKRQSALTNQRVIVDWCGVWEREQKGGLNE